MITYALDTNTVSFIIKGNASLAGRLAGEILKGNRIVLPPVALYEIRRWLLFNHSGNKAEAFDELCAGLDLEDMPKEAFEIAAGEHARLKREGYTLDDADLFIAGFCMGNDYVLITNNSKHFNLIGGLKTEDWRVKG